MLLHYVMETWFLTPVVSEPVCSWNTVKVDFFEWTNTVVPRRYIAWQRVGSDSVVAQILLSQLRFLEITYCCTKETSGLHNYKINHLTLLFYCGNKETHQWNISAYSLTSCISLCSDLNLILGPRCLDSCQWITHRRGCWQCTTTVWDKWTVVQENFPDVSHRFTSIGWTALTYYSCANTAQRVKVMSWLLSVETTQPPD